MIKKVSKILVDIDKSSYCVYIGNNNLCTNKNEYFSRYLLSKVAIVTNPTIYSLYKKLIQKLHLNYNLILIPDGEEHKTNKTVSKIYEELILHKFPRESTIIAIGGGVVGDMAGFVAATYQRGINLIHIPTTIMSQVDSSIGGKTGYNNRLGKNLVGAFYHPKIVITDIRFLLTLNQRHMLSGIAEIIKYSLINQTPSFDWLEQNLVKLRKGDLRMLNSAIIECCKCKADIVSKDEKEKNLRMILNFGHTFGHAIEAATHYKRYTHGEAISIGMLIAAFISKKKYLLSNFAYQKIKELICNAGLPISIPKNVCSRKLLTYVTHDKKCLKDGNVRLILLRDIGVPCFCKKLKFSEIINLFNEFRAT